MTQVIISFSAPNEFCIGIFIDHKNIIAGRIQRLFWRRDCHCFFMNWIVVVDVYGNIVFSRPGFVGHLADSTCYRNVTLPAFPQGLHIMADQGFANQSPLLLPIDRRGRIMRGIMK